MVSKRREWHQQNQSGIAMSRCAVAGAGGALTNYFPPLTHGPLRENKKVNAQRFELPGVRSGGRQTLFPTRGERRLGLALAQAAR